MKHRRQRNILMGVIDDGQERENEAHFLFLEIPGVRFGISRNVMDAELFEEDLRFPLYRA